MIFNNITLRTRAMLWVLVAVVALPLGAQELRTSPDNGPAVIKDAMLDVAPGVIPMGGSLGGPEALWDLQFNYNATDATPTNTGGMAAITHIGTEFWVAKWGSDTLYRFNNSGTWIETFFIPSLSGVRGLTWDGTFIYASNNTSSIHKINPSTKTIVGTITAPISQVRMMAYDPTLAGGSGGLYIGNFNTDITVINLSGSVIGLIPASTHGLTGMYSCAYDPYSTGGPYLWVFAQSGSPSNTMLHQLTLPDGMPTGNVHDCSVDVGVGVTGGLAGGMFISNSLVPGQKTIGGLMQGTPNRLFGYELSDPPPVDGSLSGFRSVPGYTMIPNQQVVPFGFQGLLTNVGSDTILNPRLVVEVSDFSGTIWSDTVATGALQPGEEATLITGNFTPTALGSYTAKGYFTLVGGSDGFSSNDTARFAFKVTDSTYARDNGVPTGTGYSVTGAGEWAYATCLWSLPNDDTLTGVWISLDGPVEGDTTYAVVANTLFGEPTTVIATGIPVIISSAVKEYWLRFPAPVGLASGEYAIGVYESFDSTLNMDQSALYHTAGMNHYYTPSAGWVPSNIATARFIRPMLGADFAVSTQSPLASSVAVYPNPSTGDVSVGLSLPSAEWVEVRITDLMGHQVMERSLGQVSRTASLFQLGEMADGIYLVQVKAGTEVVTHKVVLRK